MGGHSEASWEQVLGPPASSWAKGPFCLSQGSEPLSRDTFWVEDKVNKLVLQGQLPWVDTAMFNATENVSLSGSHTAQGTTFSLATFSRGHDGWDNDVTFWRES